MRTNSTSKKNSLVREANITAFAFMDEFVKEKFSFVGTFLLYPAFFVMSLILHISDAMKNKKRIKND
jgi:hypothetical protein